MQTTVGAKLHKNEMKLYKFKKERKNWKANGIIKWKPINEA